MKILLITRSPTTIDSILPMIRDGGFEAVGTTIDSEALAQIESAPLMLSSSVEASRRTLADEFDQRRIPIVLR